MYDLLNILLQNKQHGLSMEVEYVIINRLPKSITLPNDVKMYARAYAYDFVRRVGWWSCVKVIL